MTSAQLPPERWRALQDVVDGALDRPPTERSAFLIDACSGDAELHALAHRLVAACERAGRANGLLSGSAVDLAAPLLTEATAAEAARREERRATAFASVCAALSDRYDVQREIGRGGTATVYLAHDQRHDRTVAIKVLEQSVDPGTSARFVREIRTAARMTHPHVLGIHDSGETDGFLYYVMPLVSGETLRAWLEREPRLTLQDARRVMREIAEALTYAHAQGVVHRDLKPENILISGGHAVVADFGIAKALAVATDPVPHDAAAATNAAALPSATISMGTPAYMAPEQAEATATDHRADLYVLGVIAYEMLAGEHPFGVRTSAAYLDAHRSATPRPLRGVRRDVPPRLEGLVLRLLEKDPRKRLQSAEDVLRALDDVGMGARSMRRPVRAIVAALTIVLLPVGYLGFRSIAPDARTSTAPDSRTIAVLPFNAVGGTAGVDVFGEGLTDELAHALARVPGLDVAGRTSSNAFRGTARTPQEIGRELGVGAIVTGTVRRAGERTRVSVQLVSTSRGTILWEDVYETGSTDMFAIQEDIARGIAAALSPALGAAELPRGSRRTLDQEAYDLFLQGRYHFLERGLDNVRLAIDYYRRAVARDPAFARAHAGLAAAYAVLPVYDIGSADTAMALLRTSARRAIALDSTLADAQNALGLALESELRFTEAEARYRTALAYEPSNVNTHHFYGFLLISLGRTDEAIATLQRAAQLDPLAKSAASAYAHALMAGRRYDEAIAVVNRVVALDSTFPLALFGLGAGLAAVGQPDSAVVLLERVLEMHPGTHGMSGTLLYAYGAAGRWADVRRHRAALAAEGRVLEAAIADLVLGDAEPLIQLLMTREGQRSWWDIQATFGCHPLLDPLWQDSRFVVAMRDLGLAACETAKPWPFTPPLRVLRPER